MITNVIIDDICVITHNDYKDICVIFKSEPCAQDYVDMIRNVKDDVLVFELLTAYDFTKVKYI